MTTKRVLVLNDLHIPFHSTSAVNLVMSVAKDVQVDEIIINGDLLDFYNINSHGPKHPHVISSLEDEIYEGRTFLEELRDLFPKAKIHFIYGNHEHRLDRFIMQYCKAFFNLVKLESMLNLKGLKIDHTPYNSPLKVCPDLYVQHSPPSYGVNGARTSLLKKHDASFIWGCSHRVQHATITGHTSNIYQAWFNGWLGSTSQSKSHKEVFSYAKEHHEWQQAFSIVDCHNSKWQNNQVVIREEKYCFLDGAYYEI